MARDRNRIPDEVAVALQRRRYADIVMDAAGVRDPRIHAVFANVPREAFLPPPPWTVISRGTATRTSRIADLYQDVLVALDREQGINNGEPALHAAWLAAVDPRAGETAIHVGAGTGYYTAMLADLVAGGGRVEAYEIHPGLAGDAARNLRPYGNVVVHAQSAFGCPLPARRTVDLPLAAAFELGPYDPRHAPSGGAEGPASDAGRVHSLQRGDHERRGRGRAVRGGHRGDPVGLAQRGTGPGFAGDGDLWAGLVFVRGRGCRTGVIWMPQSCCRGATPTNVPDPAAVGTKLRRIAAINPAQLVDGLKTLIPKGFAESGTSRRGVFCLQSPDRRDRCRTGFARGRA
jgi:protein-L-isoaspartate O-methyltransferase